MCLYIKDLARRPFIFVYFRLNKFANIGLLCICCAWFTCSCVICPLFSKCWIISCGLLTPFGMLSPACLKICIGFCCRFEIICKICIGSFILFRLLLSGSPHRCWCVCSLLLFQFFDFSFQLFNVFLQSEIVRVEIREDWRRFWCLL